MKTETEKEIELNKVKGLFLNTNDELPPRHSKRDVELLEFIEYINKNKLVWAIYRLSSIRMAHRKAQNLRNYLSKKPLEYEIRTRGIEIWARLKNNKKEYSK